MSRIDFDSIPPSSLSQTDDFLYFREVTAGKVRLNDVTYSADFLQAVEGCPVGLALCAQRHTVAIVYLQQFLGFAYAIPEHFL
ncbi:MAG: hypothetical protein Q4B71_00465 [Cardiobacteriaceae bacterium]|nr:hypothetical protein [Cardiobacteriaceae bacterium]